MNEMMTLSMRFAEIRPVAMMQRDWNSLVREAMAAAAYTWLARFKDLHFGRPASQRYGYRPRKPEYNRIKGRSKRVFNRRHGVWQEMPKPVEDMQWTGDLKRMVMLKAPSAFRVIATATANRARVRVPIPLGHEVPPWLAEELTKITPEELVSLHSAAMVHMRRQLAAGHVIVATPGMAMGRAA